MPADDLTDPAPATTFAHLDATTVLSRGISELGIYPAVDPLDSTSRILDPTVVGQDHYDTARSVQKILQVSYLMWCLYFGIGSININMNTQRCNLLLVCMCPASQSQSLLIHTHENSAIYFTEVHICHILLAYILVYCILNDTCKGNCVHLVVSRKSYIPFNGEYFLCYRITNRYRISLLSLVWMSWVKMISLQ